MKYIGIVFSLLGIGLHFRMMEFLLDAELFASFRLQWDTSPLENRFLIVGAMIVPFAFYVTCIAACLAKHRTMGLTLLAVAIGISAFFYFTHLHTTLPYVAKNSMYAAFFSLIPYWVKPKLSPEPPNGPEAEPA